MPTPLPPRPEDFPPSARIGRVIVEVVEDFFGLGPRVRIRVFTFDSDFPTEVFLDLTQSHRLAGFLLGVCRAGEGR